MSSVETPDGDDGGESDPLLEEIKSFGLRPTSFVRRPAQPPGFEVIRELSRGGQGVVYEATQRSTGRRVALKVGLARDLGDADDTRSRREVRLLASLKHENLTTVFESGSEDGWRWLAMEFIEGEDIATWARGQGVGARRVVDRFVRVCDAVALAHRHGIVHRDLKPSNIMVDGDDRPVVLDFGLAKSFGDPSLTTPELTQPGVVVGSPLWLAPEQIHSPDEVGPRADVYALGRVLYHLLSEEHPYPGSPSGPQWLKAIQEREPLPLRRVAPSGGIDTALEAIVMKAIDREPARRYADADAMRADLVAWLEGRETVARPQGTLGRVLRRARRHPRNSAALLVFVAVLTAAWIGSRQSAPSRWAREVREAAALSPSRSLTELWSRHLDPPAGVARPETPDADSASGPVPTHYALLARYLAEPCLGRLSLPPEADPESQMLTAPLGDVVLLRPIGSDEAMSTLWVGRDPDFTWRRFDFDRPLLAVRLSPDGQFLAARDPVGGWRLWEGEPTSSHELPWFRERAPTGIALVGSSAATPETHALIRDRDGSLHLVRASDGSEIATFPSVSARLTAADAPLQAAMSPDGGRLVVWISGSDVWVASISDPAAAWQPVEGVIGRSFSFIDADTIAVEGYNVRLVHLEPDGLSIGKPLFSIGHRASPVWLEGGTVAARCTNGVELFPRGAFEPSVRWSASAQIRSCGAVRGGRVLVTLDVDGFLTLWDLSRADATVVPPWRRLLPWAFETAQSGSVFGVAFSPSNDRLAVATTDPSRLYLQALPITGDPWSVSLPAGDRPNCLDWSTAHPQWLAVGCLSGRVYLVPTTAGEEPVLYGELGGEVHAVQCSPDGRHLFAGGGVGERKRGRVRVWRVGEPGRLLRTVEDPSVGRVTSLAFDERGERLAVGIAGSDFVQWLAPPLEGEFAPVIDPRPASECVIRDLVWRASGVFSAHVDKTVRFTRSGADHAAAEYELDDQPFSLDVHPSGALVAAGGFDGRLHLLSFDGDQFTPAATIPFPALESSPGSRQIFRVRFSSDGRFLVVGGEPGTVPCYLDLDDAARCMAGNVEWVIDRHESEPRGAALAEAWAEAILAR